MLRQTVTRKTALALRNEVKRSYAALAEAERETQRTRDEVHELKVQKGVLQDELDAMAAKLNKMGTDIGAASMRVMMVHEVALTALNGMGAIASAAGNGSQIASTLRALERDGRTQLKLAVNGAQA